MYYYLYLICHIFFQYRCCATEFIVYWVTDKIAAKLFEEGSKILCGWRRKQPLLFLDRVFQFHVIYWTIAFLSSLSSLLFIFLPFFPLSSCVYPLINAAYIYISTYLRHWGIWGMHNAFVGNVKNIICCSYPQEFAAIWEDMIYMHEMLNIDSRFEWQYRNINQMSTKYYQLLAEGSVQTRWSEKALLSSFTLLEHAVLTYTFRFYQVSYLIILCLFFFPNVSQILLRPQSFDETLSSLWGNL